MMCENGVVRVNRNYGTSIYAPPAHVAGRRYNALKTFTEPMDEDEPPGAASSASFLSTLSIKDAGKRRFMKPSHISRLYLNQAGASDVGEALANRQRLYLHPDSVLRNSVFQDVLLPATIGLLSEDEGKGSQRRQLVATARRTPQPSSPSEREALAENKRSSASQRSSSSGTFSDTRESYVGNIWQTFFIDNLNAASTAQLGNICNADWTCDGKFVVICCRKGILLGDVSTVSIVSTIAGDFGRVACHPTLPTAFAGLLNSSSLVIYEICERPSSRSITRPTYVMKVTAEMKFTSVKLSGSVLTWSPPGTLLAVCNQDRGLYVLAYEDVAQASNGNTFAGGLRPTGRPVRTRRVLRIVAQRKFDSKVVSVTFLSHSSVPEHEPTLLTRFPPDGFSTTDGSSYDFTGLNLSKALPPLCDPGSGASVPEKPVVLYVLLDTGRLMACETEKVASGTPSRPTSDGKTTNVKPPYILSPGGYVTTGSHVACVDADPSGSRFLVLGEEDDSLSVLDTVTHYTIGTHYRLFGPVRSVAVSAAGALIAWAPHIENPCHSKSAGSDSLNGSGNLAVCPASPYVGISVLNPLDMIWKCNVLGSIAVLRWHPWLPILLVAYNGAAKSIGVDHGIAAGDGGGSASGTHTRGGASGNVTGSRSDGHVNEQGAKTNTFSLLGNGHVMLLHFA